MKIILVCNKNLPRENLNRMDSGYYNVYIPLIELGHQVYFYDTINPKEKDFSKVVERFQPDLIFCCLTGNPQITPYEPIEEIKQITNSGKIKTFNWFCDDTWRFESFSQYFCHYFNVCSTPEYSYIQKFKQSGYSNIILGQWHCNEDLYLLNQKKYNIGFCGGLNQTRLNFLKQLNQQVSYFSGCSYEDMISLYASCKIVLNLTINDNDTQKKRQMKLRIFEATCANSMLLTENVENIEMYYKPNNEIICFENVEECIDRTQFFLNNESEMQKITQKGNERFLKEHTSKIRLNNLLKEINKI
jgi:spore maturation protein CgeB